ncbi:MAG: hypothetical protein LWW97_09625, partial [Deltaproteobacteria bacterium]|nr:hypothetical protein [Deltaproteobacteria bacterium]
SRMASTIYSHIFSSLFTANLLYESTLIHCPNFGEYYRMWKDNDIADNVNEYVRNLRKGRF